MYTNLTTSEIDFFFFCNVYTYDKTTEKKKNPVKCSYMCMTLL